jgi:Putative Actinobacterial Holin-X, holin superfamily III
MHEEFKKIEEAAEHLKSYLNAKIAQMKLATAESISDMLSVFIAKMVAGCVFFIFILFVSIAAAYGLADYFGKLWMGFLTVGGIYLLAGMLIWFARERLLRLPIMNAIVKRLFIQEIEEDEKNQKQSAA